MRTIHSLDHIPADHWINQYHQRLYKQKLSPLTIRGYTYDLMHFRSWLVKTYHSEPEIEKISPTDIAAYRYYLIDSKQMKPSSVNRRIQAVKKCFSWANEKGLTDSDLAQEIRFLKSPNRFKPEHLTQKEVYALLRVAGQSTHGLAKRNYALVQLFVQTGIRTGEAAELRLKDISLHERSGFMQITKNNGLKQRHIPLNVAVRKALSIYIQSRTLVEPDAFLFHSKRNTQISVRTIQEVITQLAKKAHIKRIKVTAHTLRHTFAINYLKDNPGKLSELAELMGHESMDSVSIYTRPSRKD